LRMNGVRLAAGLGLAVVSGVAMQGAWNANPWLSLALKLPAGAVFAACCLLIIAPQGLAQGLAQARHKLQGVA